MNLWSALFKGWGLPSEGVAFRAARDDAVEIEHLALGASHDLFEARGFTHARENGRKTREAGFSAIEIDHTALRQRFAPEVVERGAYDRNRGA